MNHVILMKILCVFSNLQIDFSIIWKGHFTRDMVSVSFCVIFVDNQQVIILSDFETDMSFVLCVVWGVHYGLFQAEPVRPGIVGYS